ncbi:unnamed protein product, partial [Owenia fusiformis]
CSTHVLANPEDFQQTTQLPTTQLPTTQLQTTQLQTTHLPTTQLPTTQLQTTQLPTTQLQTTHLPTTQLPTTQLPTTQLQTTHLPTTQLPTTQLQTTQLPTTQLQTTQLPTTQLHTTQLQTTQLPSSTRSLTSSAIPRSSSYRPLKSSAIPRSSSYRPLKSSAIPRSSSYRPLKSSAIPRSSSYKHLTTSALPRSSSFRHLPTIAVPKSSSFQPRTTVIAPTPTRREYSTASSLTIPVAPITSLGAGHVNCSADLNIDILVPSSIITKENLNIGEPLHVEGNRDCKIDYNGGLGIFAGEMPLSKCFTLTENQDSIMYEAKIIGGNAPAKNGVIIRKSQFALAVMCKYDRLAEIEPAKFVATRGRVSYKDEEMGEFTFTLKLYDSANTTEVLSPEKEVATTERVYADVRMTDADNSGLKMGVQNCFASPSSDRKNAINTYSLIEKRCFKDSTVFTVRSSGTQYKFGFLAFQFTGDIKRIYLHCQAAVCKVGDRTGACDQPNKVSTN